MGRDIFRVLSSEMGYTIFASMKQNNFVSLNHGWQFSYDFMYYTVENLSPLISKLNRSGRLAIDIFNVCRKKPFSPDEKHV